MPRLHLIPKVLIAVLLILAFRTLTLYGQAREFTALKVYFLDAGQGDAALLHHRGVWILLDGGDQDDRKHSRNQRLDQFLRSEGVKRLDLAVLSHAHSDHLGGLTGVLAGWPVQRVLEPGKTHTTLLYDRYRSLLSSRGISAFRPPPGTVIRVGSDLLLTVLWPPPGEENQWDLNNYSLVVQAEFAGRKLLFTGDIEAPAEKQLVEKYGRSLASEVLKVPHHGSSTSSTRPFLDAVSPQIAVISCGSENPYGFPSVEVVKRLGTYARLIHRTDRDGTLRLRIDQKGITVSRHYRKKWWRPTA